MIDIGPITTENLSDTEGLKLIAAEVSSSIFFLDNQATDDQVKLPTHTIVIITAPLTKSFDFLKNCPPSCTILYLGDNKTIVDTLQNCNSSLLIDYLLLPVSTQLFVHKLKFLKKVHRIATQQLTQATSLNQQLELLYNRDGLTGLYTRRSLTDHLQDALYTAQTQKAELSLLMLNIDYLNNVNKSCGLEFGDLLLNSMAARLTDTAPKNATCYRFSGEDFVVLLPETELKKAGLVADEVRLKCSEKPFTDGKKSISITLSIGIASLQMHNPVNHTEFISMAETALFSAKAEGRNRVQIYSLNDGEKAITTQQSLTVLKENLDRILGRTRDSAIASLQLLTTNIAGPEHQIHIEKVTEYLTLLGDQMGLPNHYTHIFTNALTLYSSFRCLLHKEIYSKPTRLTEQEREIVEDLPFKLSELVDMFDYFAEERNVLLSHCERYDGSGYPLGLAKDEIPLGARIFHIVDALAAMNGERSYRKKLSPEEIIIELHDGAGKQFDPYLVSQIFILLENNQLLALDPEFINSQHQELLKRFPELTI